MLLIKLYSPRGVVMQLSKLIKTYRKSNELTMEEFAKKAKTTKQYISMLEKNKNSRSGRPIAPSLKMYKKIANAMNLELDDLLKIIDADQEVSLTQKNAEEVNTNQGIKIPVLGNIAAGIPITATTDIEDYEEIPQKLANAGEYFALKIKGDSMLPRIADGDVVIVRQQSTVETGDVAVILVNGDEATIKEVKKTDSGIMLIGWNTAVYSPAFYSNEEIETLPVTILGKVVECRCKF